MNNQNPSPFDNRPRNNNNINVRKRALYEEEKRIRKAKRARKIHFFIQKATAVCVFSLIGLVISLSALFILINYDFSRTSSKAKSSVEIESELFTDNLKLSEDLYSYRNNEHYVSLSVFTKHFNTRLTGDVKRMTLPLSDKESATVAKLKREKEAFFDLKDLQSGEFRKLTPKEVAKIYSLEKKDK